MYSLFMMTPLCSWCVFSRRYLLVFLFAFGVSDGIFAGARTVVRHQDFQFYGIDLGDRPWQPPQFDNQKHAIGYSNRAFEVPDNLKESVDFWVQIYSKYSTQEGVLHDSRYPHVVYEAVSFEEINARGLSPVKTQLAKERHVRSRKKIWESRLLSLQRKTSSQGLTGEDLRIWQLFEKIKEANKFKKASRKGRLRFQLGQKDRFLQGIYFSGRFLDKMEVLFREEGLPVELTRIPFVESSFNLAARSKVGASGIWQFMRSTGRQYMRVNRTIDERNAPLVATVAAAKFFRYSYKKLGSWPLAVTAYNHGPAGMRRLARRLKTNDLADIIQRNRSSRFGFASSNFYTSFLAALHVEQEASSYFENVRWAEPFEFDEVIASKPFPVAVLLPFFDNNVRKLQLYNPHFSRSVFRNNHWIPRRTKLRLIKGTGQLVAEAISKAKSKPRREQNRMAKKSGGGRKYCVRRGETLSHIALKFGTTVRAIMKKNGLSSSRYVRAGQVLTIP